MTEKLLKHIATIPLAILFAFCLSSQDSQVRIVGSAFDKETGNKLINILVVNKTNGNGTFGDKYGDYNILVGKNDSIVISAFGYSSFTFSLKDSIPRTAYSIKPLLSKPLYFLKPVTIIAERELEDIVEDIQELGYTKEDYMLSGVDALQSPITFLYQVFSRRERSKRLVAELVNEERKRRLLKELFRKYIDYEIIDLEDNEFDEFIDYCSVSESFLQSSSQYEFLMYIKYMYRQWGNVPHKEDLLPEIDFDKY
ncbi:MAG: hypothetical protein HKN39_00960 [Flavobacteriales bacterium]|nr:hypothetical protein [Flavobacteriales bacterium]